VDFDSLGGVLLGAVLLTFLVSARQFGALRDYGRLAVRYQQLASIDGMTGLYNRWRRGPSRTRSGWASCCSR
jgi:hypothetical protein